MIESRETIFVDPAGNTIVTSPNGEEWYFITTNKVEPSDFVFMQELDPGHRPYILNDQNLSAWREWAQTNYEMLDQLRSRDERY
jgi:hypothetical protein